MRALAVVVMAGCTQPALLATPDATLPVPTDEHGEPLPSAGTATLREGTIVLPAWMTKDATLELSAVVFPADGNDALFELVRGDIIVSGTGDGFLRRVYAVESAGDAIRVVTSPATLADAVIDATFHMTAADPMWTPARIDSRIGSLHAVIDGELSFAPAIELGFALANGALTAFDLHVTGTGSARVEGTLDFAAATHWAWGEEHANETPVFRRAFALGPLPLVVVGRMTTTLAASAYVDDVVTFAGGTHAELTIDAASHFTPAGWTTTDASRVAVMRIGPTYGGPGRASLAVGLDPELELAFYGEDGAALHLVMQAGGFGMSCGSAPITALQSAVQGTVTYELAPLVKSGRSDVTLWDRRQFLDELETCAP